MPGSRASSFQSQVAQTSAHLIEQHSRRDQLAPKRHGLKVGRPSGAAGLQPKLHSILAENAAMFRASETSPSPPIRCEPQNGKRSHATPHRSSLARGKKANPPQPTHSQLASVVSCLLSIALSHFTLSLSQIPPTAPTQRTMHHEYARPDIVASRLQHAAVRRLRLAKCMGTKCAALRHR